VIQIGGSDEPTSFKKIGSKRKSRKNKKSRRKNKKRSSKNKTNPYMPGKGTDKISQASIKQIKDKLKTVYVEGKRKEILEKWNKRMAAKLKNGLWSN